MAKLRKQYTRFAWLPNAVVDDPKLSWKAKGILLYLNSKPDGWKFNHADLRRRSKDGQSSVQSGVEELKVHGYLTVEAERDESGKVKEWIWTIIGASEGQPDPENPDQAIAHNSNTVSSNTVKDTLGGEQKIEQRLSGMHEILTSTLFPTCKPQPKLTDKRKEKYQGLWDEHLAQRPDWREIFTRICIDVRDDEFLSQKRDWQYPESFLRNPERREKRMTLALSPSHDGPTVPTANGYSGRQPWI